MTRVHDMGGAPGFGPVVPEPNEPPFHARWEGRMLAMQRAMAFTRQWSIDQSRASQEALPRDVYLATSYYERWYLGMESRLIAQNLVTGSELASGHALTPGKTGIRKLTSDKLPATMVRGEFARPARAPARFAAGDAVRTTKLPAVTHTRLPRYAAERFGMVEAIRGCHVFPDSLVDRGEEDPQWLYTVVFEGRELWGPNGDPKLKVSIEAWEPYLEPA